MTASKSSTPEVFGIASWVVMVLGAFEIPLSLSSDIDEFSSRIFPGSCLVDLPIFSWFLYLVQSIKFNFQDVLVLAKKPFGWKIPHSSDVIFPRTNLFPKEKGYSHCKVSSTMEKCDLRLPRWQFLDLLETTIYIVEPWKKSMGYCFVHECNNAEESRKCQFFVNNKNNCTSTQMLIIQYSIMQLKQERRKKILLQCAHVRPRCT